MDNLKPCPFCGGEAILREYDDGSGHIRCNRCDFTPFIHASFGREKSKQKAIAEWNRRPDIWIPVTERLPESGKHVLLCCEVRPAMKRYICDGYYAKAKSIINSCSFDYECAVEYDEERDEYFLLEGFYEVIKNWDDFTSITIEDFVTHWMPLPEPPKEERAVG